MKDGEPVLYFRAESDGYDTYAHLHAQVLYHNDGKLTGPCFSAYDTATHFYDFQVSAQMDARTRGSYAWKCEFTQPYSVELEWAEVMVKILRRIHRALDKDTQERGYPTTFHEYVMRVAQALKIRTYIVGPDGGQATFNNGEKWRHVDSGSLQYWIQTRETTYGLKSAA